MRILAHENMLAAVVDGLRNDGHDVRRVVETNPSDPDADLLNVATGDERLLITFDTDYGELIHQDGVLAPYGVLLFRIHRDVTNDVKASFIIGTVNSADEWPPGLWTVQIRHRG